MAVAREGGKVFVGVGIPALIYFVEMTMLPYNRDQRGLAWSIRDSFH